jgi:hypothetical protein
MWSLPQTALPDIEREVAELKHFAGGHRDLG